MKFMPALQYSLGIYMSIIRYCSIVVNFSIHLMVRFMIFHLDFHLSFGYPFCMPMPSLETSHLKCCSLYIIIMMCSSKLQCQSQLKRLYAEGIKGCDNEFSAYHLLHVCLHSNNKRDLLSSMAGSVLSHSFGSLLISCGNWITVPYFILFLLVRLSIQSKQDDAVKHALKVRSAVSSGNYLLFFRLYKAAPNLNTCLMG